VRSSYGSDLPLFTFVYLCLDIGLRWRTTVSWYIVRFASYHRGYFEAGEGLFLLGFMFSILSIGEGRK
jgi:hypothetical protein